MTSESGLVYVVDDDEAARQAIESLLRSVGLKVQAFGSAVEFLDHAKLEEPSCLVLDVRLPGMSGLEFQRELKKRHIDLGIIFITGHGDIPMSVEAMKAGAMEFLTKPFRGQVLLDAIQKAIESDRARRQENSRLEEVLSRVRTLTPREREVMDHVVAGLLNKQIAAELGLSERTVKIHRAQVMRKMEAQSLPELVRLASLLP